MATKQQRTYWESQKALTKEQADTIRYLYNNTTPRPTQDQLAAQFHVSRYVIFRILNDKTY